MTQEQLKILQFQLSEAQKTINTQKESLDAIKNENENLQKQLKAEIEDRDLLKFIHSKALSEKDGKIEKLQNNIEEVEKSSIRDRKEMQADYEKQIKSFEEALRDNAVRVHRMQSELDLLHDYKVERVKLMEELEVTKKEAEETKNAADEKVVQIERKFWEEKLRIEEELEQHLEKIKKIAEKEAQQKMSGNARQVFIENQKIENDLRTNAELAKEFDKSLEASELKCRELKSENAILAQQVRQLIKKCTDNKKSLRNHDMRIAEIEQQKISLQEQLQEEQKIPKMTSKKQKEYSESLLDVAGLRRLLAIKVNELNHIRRLAQKILDQRSEVESFFLESLEVVKSELALRRAEAAKRAKEAHDEHFSGFSTKKDLPVFATSRQAHLFGQSLTHDTKVYVKDLSWEDREKVLRHLFARINIAYSQRNAKREKNNQRKFALVEEEVEEQPQPAPEPDLFNYALPSLVPPHRQVKSEDIARAESSVRKTRGAVAEETLAALASTTLRQKR